jgi:threonine synthase
MKLYNLKDHNEQVSFAQAVTQGLGKNQGLFFPHDLPEFSLTEIDDMLKQDLSPAAQNSVGVYRR